MPTSLHRDIVSREPSRDQCVLIKLAGPQHRDYPATQLWTGHAQPRSKLHFHALKLDKRELLRLYLRRRLKWSAV